MCLSILVSLSKTVHAGNGTYSDHGAPLLRQADVQGAVPDERFQRILAIGENTSSDASVAAIEIDKNDDVYICGESKPFDEFAESDLPGADREGLRGSDFFCAKVLNETGTIAWLLRSGTSEDDLVADIVLDTNEAMLYILGETYGDYGGNVGNGQSDVFVEKFDVSGDSPRRVWQRPTSVGSPAIEGAFKIRLSEDSKSLFITGSTRGNMFGPSLGSSDVFLSRIDTETGAVMASTQFGTSGADDGRDIVVPTEDDPFVYVAVEGVRPVGDVRVTNINLFKFSIEPDFQMQGSMLLRTYSNEDVAALIRHPKLPEFLFTFGSSWLELINGWEVNLKRVLSAFTTGARTVVGVNDLVNPQFSMKVGSVDKKNEHGLALMYDEPTERYYVAGATSGDMTGSISRTSNSQTFVASFSPNNGEMTHVAQQQLPLSNSLDRVTGMRMTSTGNIVLASTRANETTGVYYTVLTLFVTPAEWREPISIIPYVPSTPAAVVDNDRTTEAQESIWDKVPKEAVFGGAAGLVALVLLIGGIATFTKLKKRSDAAQLVRSKSQRARAAKKSKGKKKKKKKKSASSPRRPPPVARPGQVDSAGRDPALAHGEATNTSLPV